MLPNITPVSVIRLLSILYYNTRVQGVESTPAATGYVTVCPLWHAGPPYKGT